MDGACMTLRKMRTIYRILVRRFEEKIHLRVPSAEERIIFKWKAKWIAWLRTETNRWLL
jgi:hypothetical protein